MKLRRRLLCMLLATLMALTCLAGAVAESEAPAEELRLQPGDAIHGFTVKEIYNSTLLNSTIYTFDHEVSGATLVYVKNDDPEVAFSIGYHTPYVDETDTNHVFEHVITSSSEKYPSQDIFFDMANRAYQTYINAHTGMTTTWYPLSSMSEDQLIKMADVYMSCMVAPTVLKDENLFKREAVRFELDDPEGDIAINGTVFAEDSGYLTDKTDNALNHMLDALYPGETASNMIGMAHWHYDDLTYEHTVETFERCYHFDNSLIFLYGDLDLDRFLGFLDDEYLSKYPAQGTDLSAWKDGPADPGFVDVQMPIPAYEGDTVEDNSVIRYAIDLDGATDVELYQYTILANLLNQIGSPLYNLRMERGIENNVGAGMFASGAKPVFLFTMDYADPAQKDDLKALAEAALAQVARDGIDPARLDMVMKAQERSAKLMRDNTNVGVNIVESFLTQWARSGDPNAYRTSEQALSALHADGQQQLLRGLALNLLMPRRSALVTSVPTPGLAEEHDREMAEYLADMKANMTEDEIQDMVAQTAAFNEWNTKEMPNNDFLISPEDLPDPVVPRFTKADVDGITVYKGETEMTGVGRYAVFFDLSGMSREELEYLMLSDNYRGQMDTSRHTAEELFQLIGEYVSDMGSSLNYLPAGSGEEERPQLCVSWASLTEDFEQSLELVLEYYAQVDFSDTDLLTYLTNVSAEGWDMSRQGGEGTAYWYSHDIAGLSADTNRLEIDVNGQDCYTLIAGDVERLAADEGYAQTLANKYTEAIKKAFTRDRLIFMSVASEAENDQIVEQAVRVLNALPGKEGADAVYELPEADKSTAICIEASMNTSYLVGDYMDDPDFTGNYLPFWYAANDLYTVPVFRFQLGAYTALNGHQWGQGCLYTFVTSDPNVRATVDALAGMSQALEDMKLTQESLNGYILKAYSNATSPQGMLSGTMLAMQQDLFGMDAQRTLEIKRQIKDAKLDDQAAAAEHIAAVMADADFCMVGNENLIRADEDCFENVISWRQGATEAPEAEADAVEPEADEAGQEVPEAAEAETEGEPAAEEAAAESEEEVAAEEAAAKSEEEAAAEEAAAKSEEEAGVEDAVEAEEAEAETVPFAYEHDPRENPEAMQDIVENPDAVYGFSPSPDSPRLKEYADALDWTDPEQVASARALRLEYHESMSELYRLTEELLGQGKHVEEIARAVSTRRNELRIESYADDPEGLEVLKKSNLEAFGDEMGPSPDALYEKYGSWQTVLEKAFNANPGMDACLGLYDDYYDTYSFEVE